MYRTKNKPRLVGSLIGVAFLLIFCWLLFRSEFKMSNYQITCSKFVLAYKSKSNWYYKLKYKVGGKTYVSARQGRNFDLSNREYLDTVDCISIAYSTRDESCIRILDEKIGNEWLWFLNENDR